MPVIPFLDFFFPSCSVGPIYLFFLLSCVFTLWVVVVSKYAVRASMVFSFYTSFLGSYFVRKLDGGY